MLLDLPVKILSEILVLLDYLSILHCSAVIFSILFPLFLLSAPSNRFADNSMPSSPHLSIFNIASSSPRRGSSMARPEGQHRRRLRAWTSYSSGEWHGVPCAHADEQPWP